MRATGVTAVFFIMAFAPGMLYAAGPADIGIEASVFSKYIWRGAAFTDDPVFQPSITAEYGGFSFNVWGNMDLTDYKDERYSVSEADYTFSWTHTLPSGEFSAGAAAYSYPGVEGEVTTTELMAGWESTLPLAPSVTLFKDVDRADGLYVLLSAGGSIPLGTLVSADVSASLGWGSKLHNRYYYEIPDMKGAFTDAAFTIGLPFGIGETLSAAPHATYILRLDRKMRDEFDTGCFVFGLTFAGGF